MQPCNDITFHEVQLLIPEQKSVAEAGREFSGNADAVVIVSQGNTVITVTNSARAELAALVLKEMLAHA